MRLNQIRDFVWIVEAGSIRAAARAHGVSHPAMTKSLRQLEDDLRVQLIRRNTRGVVPTPSGRTFLARARAIQAEVRKAEEELGRLAGDAGGTVSISVSPAAAALLAPEAIAEFLGSHPQTRMRIIEGTPSALAPLVRDQTLDFALGNRPAQKLDAGLKFRVLLRTPMVVASRRGHPLREARSLRQLADARWIGLYPPGTGGMVERAFAAAGLPFPQRYITCESHVFAFELLARTDALMPLPAQLFDAPSIRRTLTEIPLDEPFPSMVLGMCSRADTHLSPLAAALARTVTEVARRLARETKAPIAHAAEMS
jgi:LysR family transcriptional regulator, regulator of abg operon